MILGLVIGGAASADPVTFPNDPVIGTLPAHSEVTIEFQVEIAEPLNTAATQVCNQATVSGSNFSDTDTDDPTTMAVGDETCTMLRPFDFGDAPDPTYPTLLASDGARHKIFAGMQLGALNDADADGQPTAASDGDDMDGSDDEDGVTFTTLLVPGADATVEINASMPGIVDAWIDYTGDGDWDDMGEKVLDGEAVAAGVNSFMLSIPSTAVSGNTASRFRYSTAGSSLPTGEAADGEVEDYQLTIENPSIAVTKTAGAPPAEPGGSVTFSVDVDNDGTVAAMLTSLMDSIYGDITMVQGDITATTCMTPQAIAVAGDYQCTFTVNLTCNAGDDETNTLTASGTAGGVAVSAMESETVTCTATAPTITVTKTADPTTIDEPGGVIAYTVDIDNTSVSTDPVTITSLVDDIEGNLDGQGTCSVPQVIAPSGSYSCTFSASVTGNAGDMVTNTVTASGTDDESTAVSNSGQATVTITDAAPSITVGLTAMPTTVDEPGGAVTYDVVITNTSVSSDPVDIDTLTDSVEGDLDGQGTCSLPQTIAPGGTYSCSFSSMVNGNAGDMVSHTVTASGQDDDSTAVSSMGMATVTVADVLPSISVTKTAAPMTITEPGGLVSYTVEVTNTSVSTDPVTLTSLSDDLEGDLDGQGTCSVPQVIAPSTTYSCVFSAMVNGDAGDEVTNVVTASGEDDEVNAVSDTASATVGITGTDFGDAPDPTYPTLLASNGARHDIPAPVTLFLGADVDHELDGQPTADVDGDDMDGNDDEDGVDFTSIPQPGDSAMVDVTASEAGLLNAWIDFDNDGSFAGAGEQIFTDEPLIAGVNSLSYSVPAGPPFGVSQLVSRFRLDSAGGLSFDGTAADGEVEDHVVPVDSVPPTVDQVTVDGDPLEDCETLNFPGGDELTVTFDESVVGHDDPDNYRLVRPGPNGDFDTVDCTSTGDDEVQMINVDDQNPSAVISLAIPDGRYQLVVCDSITDNGGNALDGDDDGNAGGSFIIDFRLDSANLFANGHFDCGPSLAPWMTLPPASPMISYSTDDESGLVVSGSAMLDSVDNAGLGLEQCVDVDPSSPFQANPYLLEGRIRVDAGASVEAFIDMSCELFAGTGCGGGSLGVELLPGQVVSDTGGAWLLLGGELEIDDASLSARCSITAVNGDGGLPDVYDDALTFTGQGLIFEDGFESADTSAWSGVVP